MNNYISDELSFFIASLVAGVTGGIIFDFFRSVRKGREEKKVLIAAEDILMWISEAMLIFYVVYKYNSGGLRFYFFLGFAAGFVLYILTVSKTIVFLLYNIRIIIEGIVGTVLRFFKKICLCLLKPIKFFMDLSAKCVKKLIIKSKKLKKQLKMY